MFISQRAAHWKQRGKFRALKEGDANTRFFQARATTRLRHSQIQHLEVGGATLIAHDDKTAALTAYFTTILAQETATTWGFDL